VKRRGKAPQPSTTHRNRPPNGDNEISPAIPQYSPLFTDLRLPDPDLPAYHLACCWGGMFPLWRGLIIACKDRLLKRDFYRGLGSLTLCGEG
jgi:hypothetical protein